MTAMEQNQAGVVEMCGYSKGGAGCTLMLVGICLLPFAGIGLIFIIAALFAGNSSKKLYRCSLCKNPLAAANVRVCPSCHAPLKPILSWIERMEEKTNEQKAQLEALKAAQALAVADGTLPSDMSATVSVPPPVVKGAGKSWLSRIFAGCAIVILSMFVLLLVLIALVPTEPSATPTKAMPSAKEKSTPSAVLPKYKATLDNKKEGIKLVLDVAVEATLETLPDEKALEDMSRELYASQGGENYERMFLCFALPSLDPMPSTHFAQTEFNPEFKIRFVNATPEDGKWIASQRGKQWEGPGEVVGRWYWLGAGGRIRTMVKEGDRYVEYFSSRGQEQPKKMDAYGWSMKKMDGRIRFESDHPVDKEEGFYWEIDEAGRWCKYLDGNLASVELPLEQPI